MLWLASAGRGWLSIPALINVAIGASLVVDRHWIGLVHGACQYTATPYLFHDTCALVALQDRPVEHTSPVAAPPPYTLGQESPYTNLTVFRLALDRASYYIEGSTIENATLLGDLLARGAEDARAISDGRQDIMAGLNTMRDS